MARGSPRRSPPAPARCAADVARPRLACVGGTHATDCSAWRSTPADTEPCHSRAAPPRWWLPTTTRSTPRSCATCSRWSAGPPEARLQVQLHLRPLRAARPRARPPRAAAPAPPGGPTPRCAAPPDPHLQAHRGVDAQPLALLRRRAHVGGHHVARPHLAQLAQEGHRAVRRRPSVHPHHAPAAAAGPAPSPPAPSSSRRTTSTGARAAARSRSGTGARRHGGAPPALGGHHQPPGARWHSSSPNSASEGPRVSRVPPAGSGAPQARGLGQQAPPGLGVGAPGPEGSRPPRRRATAGAHPAARRGRRRPGLLARNSGTGSLRRRWAWRPPTSPRASTGGPTGKRSTQCHAVQPPAAPQAGARAPARRHPASQLTRRREPWPLLPRAGRAPRAQRAWPSCWCGPARPLPPRSPSCPKVTQQGPLAVVRVDVGPAPGIHPAPRAGTPAPGSPASPSSGQASRVGAVALQRGVDAARSPRGRAPRRVIPMPEAKAHQAVTTGTAPHSPRKKRQGGPGGAAPVVSSLMPSQGAVTSGTGCCLPLSRTGGRSSKRHLPALDQQARCARPPESPRARPAHTGARPRSPRRRCTCTRCAWRRRCCRPPPRPS